MGLKREQFLYDFIAFRTNTVIGNIHTNCKLLQLRFLVSPLCVLTFTNMHERKKAWQGTFFKLTFCRQPNEDIYYLSRMIATGRAEFRSMNSLYEFLPLVSGGAVLVEERIGIDELMYGDYQQKAREGVAEAERCTYVVAPNLFMSKLRGFAYPKNSQLAPLFDTV